jgi:lactate dehydrogenase-like 2-hydroxyacid dehydrogenase
MKKILIVYPMPKEGLTALSRQYDLTYPQENELSYEQIMEVISTYDGIISPNSLIDRPLLDRADRLRIISNYSVGYDRVDVDFATQRGIAVTNTPTSVTESTAEIALGLMFSLMRRIVELDRSLRRGNVLHWGGRDNFGQTIHGKTLGIIGMGRIGKALARRAWACGMKINYYSRTELKPTVEAEYQVKHLPLGELLRSSDVVSLNCPLNSETHHLIAERELAQMKSSAYLINSSRGRVVKESALVSALESGAIAGAGLDVFENEPSISQALLAMDQVVLTPHIGTDTYCTNVRMAEEAAKNIIDFFTTGTSKNLVNPAIVSHRAG